LDLAVSRGTLHLSLRHPEDKQVAATHAATLVQLGEPSLPPQEEEKKPAPVPPPQVKVEEPKVKPKPPSHVMMVYNGSNVFRHEFAPDGEPIGINTTLLQSPPEEKTTAHRHP
jgi:hypothetical protein